MKNKTGFTLMELMIVIAIIIILAGAVVARLGGASEKAKEAKAKAEIEEIASACRSFHADTGGWPKEMKDLFVVPTAVWDEIGHNLDSYNQSDWKGPYISRYGPQELIDPWGQNYQLKTNSTIWVSCGPSHATIQILVHRFS